MTLFIAWLAVAAVCVALFFALAAAAVAIYVYSSVNRLHSRVTKIETFYRQAQAIEGAWSEFNRVLAEYDGREGMQG